MIDQKEYAKKIEEEVTKQLDRIFVTRMYKGSSAYKLFRKHSFEILNNLSKGAELGMSLAEAFELTVKTSGIEPGRKQVTALLALAYMSFVEILAYTYVNLAILMIIAEGPALHLGPDPGHPYIRHVTSFMDLESPALSLYTKLDFLEMNGLPFFSRWIDRKLRNRIAHADFMVDDDGNFFIAKERGKKKIDLVQKFQIMLDYHRVVEGIFRRELKLILHK